MTALPLPPHWRKLRCHPITAAVCQVRHLTRSALQKPHVCTDWRNSPKCFSFVDTCTTICIFNFSISLISDSLDNGLSGHNVLGHSPGAGQGVRESDVTSVEHSKENKRSHCDRGLYCVAKCHRRVKLKS